LLLLTALPSLTAAGPRRVSRANSSGSVVSRPCTEKALGQVLVRISRELAGVQTLLAERRRAEARVAAWLGKTRPGRSAKSCSAFTKPRQRRTCRRHASNLRVKARQTTRKLSRVRSLLRYISDCERTPSPGEFGRLPWQR